ncbi:MAG TPA: DUF1028 domain-containing protein [Kineosporiaceae bacterium]|nr:DUF1028 domain-containing protein [Kineosporiaceae bacterium]
MTISIVARDAATGRFGVATTSFVLAVGSRVPRVTGYGAVAVQAGSPPNWGPVLLAALGSGVGAAEAVALLGASPVAEHAQLAVVDRQGGVSVLSGSALKPAASEARRHGVCAAANLMERHGVAEVAVGAYLTSTAASFSGRLLDGLSAADRMGADLRGRQSAALRVAAGDDDVDPAAAEVDLRVDDARDPVGELRRLHRLWGAHALLAESRGTDGLYRNVDLALAALTAAPDDQACLGGATLALLRSGRLAEAAPLLRRLASMEPRTESRINRLVYSGGLEPEIGQAALCIIASANTFLL